jgi:hypothetical protein
LAFGNNCITAASIAKADSSVTRGKPLSDQP